MEVLCKDCAKYHDTPLDEMEHIPIKHGIRNWQTKNCTFCGKKLSETQGAWRLTD